MQPLDLLAPVRFARAQRVTVWFCVPALAALMRRKGSLEPGSLPSLRWSLFCGEALPRASAEAWQAAAPHSIVENLYGPTELTIACTAYRWEGERSAASCVDGVVPIGRPNPGLDAAVVDGALRSVAEGEPGELLVSGPQAVEGYWRSPQQTAEKFAALPGSDARWVRTGDRVRRLPGGDLVYLGRLDAQIQVRGHRVELGAVEAELRRAPRVIEAAALGWPVVEGNAEGIVAFVSGAGLDREAIAASVRAQLPAYMAPQEIRTVDALPHNANGKIDRAALARELDA